VDIGLLEHCIREELNDQAPRAMAVLEPLKVVLTNYPEDRLEYLEAENHPSRPEMGTRKIAFGRTLYIERADFMEDPPPKYHRLKPGGEARLKNGYIIRCEEVVKDANGKIIELRCTYDPDSHAGGATAAGRKGTIHWVEAPQPSGRGSQLRRMLREETGGEEGSLSDRF
jgi:glutaminyl-tRNA synthetase